MKGWILFPLTEQLLMCFEMASDFMLWKELEAFSQALARASSLSYAAGIADFDGE